jgi:hypothetical protein
MSLQKKTKYEKILTAKKKPRRCSKKKPQRQETYFGYQVINERAVQGVVSRWKKLCYGGKSFPAAQHYAFLTFHSSNIFAKKLPYGFSVIGIRPILWR